MVPIESKLSEFEDAFMIVERRQRGFNGDLPLVPNIDTVQDKEGEAEVVKGKGNKQEALYYFTYFYSDII